MKPPPPPPPPESSPQYVGFECRLCQTRMYARPERVGSGVKCPDCGTVTKVPAAPAVKPQRMPDAMSGEQYDLWDADTGPLPSELIATQPTLVPIECRLCQTLYYATLKQVGEQLACPDCGRQHVVPPPSEPAPAKHAMVADRDSFQIDESAAPGDRPPLNIQPRRPMLYEEEQEERERSEAARAARWGTRARRRDARGRPIMPRWPLLSGVVPFLLSAGVPVRWFALSAAAAVAVALATYGSSSIGAGGGVVSVGYYAIMGVCVFVAGCVWAVFSLAALASIVVAITTASSEGSDRVEQWPSVNPADWLPEMMLVLLAGFVSPIPGWLVAQITAADPTVSITASVLILLPVVLLSQLENNSLFAILSGRVLASIGRCLGSWLIFYVESALLAAGCFVAGSFASGLTSLAALVQFPLYVAAILLYARLLGRLAWVLAESMGRRTES